MATGYLISRNAGKHLSGGNAYQNRGNAYQGKGKHHLFQKLRNIDFTMGLNIAADKIYKFASMSCLIK